MWGTAAVSGTVVSSAGTLLYAVLLIWKHRHVTKRETAQSSRSNLWSEQSYYTNYIHNMYPGAARTQSQDPLPPPVTDDDHVNQHLALLLRTSEPRPSPDAGSTFQINMPGDSDERETPTQTQAHPDWNRGRADSRPDSLGERQAWAQWENRGRAPNRPSSTGARSSHSRGLSREERRREIERS